MRMRSPSSAPPVYGLEGSTARTPTALPCPRKLRTRQSTKVLLPAPGGPVMPMRNAPDEKERQAASSSAAPGAPSSTMEMARESARRSPEHRRARISSGRVENAELLTLAMIPPSPARVSRRDVGRERKKNKKK